MRLSWAIAVVFSFAVGSGARADTLITVTYTGTDTGTWAGNYNPLNPPGISLGGSGSLGSSTFTATFVFSTAGHYEPFSTSGVSGYSGETYVNPQNLVTEGIFAGGSQFSSLLSFGTSGTSFASDTASSGSTSQSSSDQSLYHVSYGGLSMSVSSPDIPASILTSFQITNGLTGSGEADWNYSNIYYGGGIAVFDLTPETISVSASPDLPEPSTWAMLLIGFVGIGFCDISAQKCHGLGCPGSENALKSAQ